MKKILLGIILSAASLSAMADDYNYLTVAYDSKEQSIELATIKKITFEGDNVVVTTTEGQVTFPQSEMEKMFFSDAATAIEQMAVESADLQVSGNTLKVNGNGLVHIYGSNGALLRMAKVDGSANINLSNMPKGIYIVNMGKQTIKIVK